MSQVNAEWVRGEDAFFNTKLTNMFVNTEKNFIQLHYLNTDNGERATQKLYILKRLPIIDAFLNYHDNKLHICVIVKHLLTQGHMLLTYDAFELEKVNLRIIIDIDYIKQRMQKKNRSLAILFFTSKQTVSDDFTTSLKLKATDTDLPLVPFRVISIQNPQLYLFKNLVRNMNYIESDRVIEDVQKKIEFFLKNIGDMLKKALSYETMRVEDLSQSMHLRF